MNALPHIPVMLDDVLEHLAPKPGDLIIDATFGAGGYTTAILERGANVLALDQDPNAISAGRSLEQASNGWLRLAQTPFSQMEAALSADGAAFGKTLVDGVVLVVGVSSMQLDQAERGFSFRQDGPLDMRMRQAGPSAADVVNRLTHGDLTAIIWAYGEEKRASAVASAIVRARELAPITRTGVLAEIISKAIGRPGRDQIHPATRTFQALRIFVNQELDELAVALAAAERILVEGGRLVVVAFHSLEDRIVKRFFAERARTQPVGSRHAPPSSLAQPSFILGAKGAVDPNPTEIDRNPRARSAKLRAGVRTAAAAHALDRAALGVPTFQRAMAIEPGRT